MTLQHCGDTERKKLIVVVGLVSWLRHAPFSQAADALDPLKVAAITQARVDNPFVRVLTYVPAGKTEPRHRHPHGLSVYLTDWDASVTVDGAAELHHRKAVCLPGASCTPPRTPARRRATSSHRAGIEYLAALF